MSQCNFFPITDRSVSLKILKNELSEYVRLAAGSEIVLSRTAIASWRKSYPHNRAAVLFWQMRGWPRRSGIPVATLSAGKVEFLIAMDTKSQWEAEKRKMVR
jgi:hypothetical protein